MYKGDMGPMCRKTCPPQSKLSGCPRAVTPDFQAVPLHLLQAVPVGPSTGDGSQGPVSWALPGAAQGCC